jgi:glyoxylase-like metal-dependent hydrolase (beta-lactamase superfamily II)
MKLKLVFALALTFGTLASGALSAQDLPQNIRKISDGIYVYVGNNFNSNCGIVMTQEGVVLIDSGHNPTDSRAILAFVKKLTPLPVRLLIDTEPHPDHTTGHFVFSPPAIVIAHEGATESMKGREREAPERIQKLAGVSPEMRAALEGYRSVPPHVEYRQKATINMGERTFELMYLKAVHSEADTAVWLPKERVLFSASGIVVDQINHPRYSCGGQDDESLEPGTRHPRTRPTRHGQDFRRHGKILRLALGTRRQVGERRQISG